MRFALREAERALEKREVPVGAVVVKEGRIIGRGHNLIETLQDPTAHAEMIAITAAAATLTSWRLNDSILYVTLEPCTMCAGAILLARLKTVVYGTADPRYGACGSVLQIANHDRLDLRVEVIDGILRDESRSLLRSFFANIRNKNHDHRRGARVV